MERISRDDMYLQICKVMAQRSSCLRGQVAAVITKDNRILSTGYNGPPSGSKHCSSENCNLEASCTRAIHAEINAIAFAAKNGIPISNSTLYCLYSPCMSCAQAILQAGIIKVIYSEPYRKSEGLEFLMDNSVEIYKMPLQPFTL